MKVTGLPIQPGWLVWPSSRIMGCVSHSQHQPPPPPRQGHTDQHKGRGKATPCLRTLRPFRADTFLEGVGALFMASSNREGVGVYPFPSSHPAQLRAPLLTSLRAQYTPTSEPAHTQPCIIFPIPVTTLPPPGQTPAKGQVGIHVNAQGYQQFGWVRGPPTFAGTQEG